MRPRLIGVDSPKARASLRERTIPLPASVWKYCARVERSGTLAPMDPLTLSFALAACGALALAGRRAVPGRALVWLRAFFPSWRFFEDLGPAPTLEWRDGPDEDALGPWRPALAMPPRPLTATVFNPKGNLRFAEHALVEHLLSDLDDVPDDAPERVTALVSYRLVERLVMAERASVAGAPPGGCVQFRIVLRAPGLLSDDAEVALVSAVHAA